MAGEGCGGGKKMLCWLAMDGLRMGESVVLKHKCVSAMHVDADKETEGWESTFLRERDLS